MKTKKYWLRGGIVGAIIGLVATLLGNGVPIFSYLSAPGLIGGLFVGGLSGCPFFNTDWSGNPVGPAYCVSLEWASVILLSIVFYFVVGALIGWILGKVWNRNRTVSQ